ncbi:uncharacterized protein LOC127726356 [Mytilus californianus]|uniref:uncharacterized protein LOC127726356 n=1 Tax=Mytilus californianus TaxID=6549 RepID=UPI00224804E4|nr:uncharacterized protein LOC127726356 [Mytilus californianus]
MTFVNSTYIKVYSVNIPGVNFFHFYCSEQRGNKYFLKAEQENKIFGLIIYFYMCIEIHVVDSDIAYYYQLTEHDQYLFDNLVGDGTNSATFNNVCSRTLVTRNFITLVRDGSIADGSLSKTCPEDLLAKFANVSIQHNDKENTSTCPNTVFDVCTDDTVINITYVDTCVNATTDKTLSDLGVYRCIHDVKDGSDTYLSIWNDDPGVSNPFSCLALRRTGNTIYATETPKFCSNTTTSTEAEAGGVKLVIWDVITKSTDTTLSPPVETTEVPPSLSVLTTESPPSHSVGTTEASTILPAVTTDGQPSLVGLYAHIISATVFLLILVAFFGICCCRKYRCASKN